LQQQRVAGQATVDAQNLDRGLLRDHGEDVGDPPGDRLECSMGDVPGVDVRVGEDRTTEAGEYKVFGEDVAEGSYYAEADRRTLKLTVDHRHVCRAVRSQDISAAP